MKYFMYTFMLLLFTALVVLNFKYDSNLDAAETIIEASEFGLEDLTTEQKEYQKELLEKSLEELDYKNVNVDIKEVQNNKVTLSVNAYKYKYIIFFKKQLSYYNEI